MQIIVNIDKDIATELLLEVILCKDEYIQHFFFFALFFPVYDRLDIYLYYTHVL